VVRVGWTGREKLVIWGEGETGECGRRDFKRTPKNY